MALIMGICAYAQNTMQSAPAAKVPASDVQNKIQLGVYVPEDGQTIPLGSRQTLNTRIKNILARNGMAGTDNITQFFVTCDALVLEKNIVPGAPTKYQQKIELNLYVIDMLDKKCYGNVSIQSHAVANSEQKAYNNCFNQIPTSTEELKSFFAEASANIIRYYDSQADNIINTALTLARGKKYEEALWRLNMVPMACKSYQKVLSTAIDIYNQYVDMKSFEELAKARAIWNAGQDAAAAAAAGVHIANVNPNAKCYPDAVALSNEIKARVKSDIDYYRKQDEIDREREHVENMAEIEAWRQVGVAYGNNQKSNSYHDFYTVR